MNERTKNVRRKKQRLYEESSEDCMKKVATMEKDGIGKEEKSGLT